MEKSKVVEQLLEGNCNIFEDIKPKSEDITPQLKNIQRKLSWAFTTLVGLSVYLRMTRTEVEKLIKQ